MSTTSQSPLRKTRIALAALVTVGFLVGVLWSSNQQLQAAVSIQATATTQLARDMLAIERLQTKPHVASEFDMPQADVMARIQAAMTAASIPHNTLASSVPQAPRRLNKSSLLEVTQRLSLEDVPLEKLTGFLFRVTEDNPGFEISTIALRPTSEARYNADIGISHFFVREDRHIAHQPPGAQP